MSRLGLLIIATGRYLDFADTLLADVDTVIGSGDVVANLFTDAEPAVVRRIQQRHEVSINALPVPKLRWPEASLYRYELFTTCAADIQGDVLVYLDADLRVQRDFTPLLTPLAWPGRMAAVRHPGFYRQRRLRPRGTWESRPVSQAYVPPHRRRNYVCGGVWAGERTALLGVSEELRARVRTDAGVGVTARWHDESHWNWWVANHPVELLDPSWCYVPDYPWLSHLVPLIVAVDKGHGFEREITSHDVKRAVAHRPPPASEEFVFRGVTLVDIDLDGAVAILADAAETGVRQGIHLCNAYTLSLAARDRSYRAALQHPDSVNLPDGTPVSWYYRLLSRRTPRGPVRGPSLMKAALARPGLRHFLLGGTPEVLDDLREAIARDFPQASVVGHHSPAFGEPTEPELDGFASRIRESGAQIVWIGLGTPRQDVTIARLVPRTDAVLVGVGAAFDFLSGNKPEAPAVLHGTGFEWLHRLVTEPRRMWRRYLVGNTVFVVHAARQLLRRRFRDDRSGDLP
jgi:N-acetylglucosaminyldiphosphoundecaprenol N-acetyl-beta-D-mannosaminyltransferase